MLGSLNKEDKVLIGKTLNVLKKEIDECFNEKKKVLYDIEINKN